MRKWSSLAAIAHLLAKNREIFPLFLPMARPIKEVLKRSPYLGVFVFYFKALNKAFSAPKIWMVEAGYLAKVLKEPEWAISLAAIDYPMRLVRFGDTISIRSLRYSWISFLNSNILKVFTHNYWRQVISNSLIYWPIEFNEDSITFSAISPSRTNSSTWSTVTSVACLFPIKLVNWT